MVLFKVAKVIYFLCTLLEAPENYNFFKVEAWMKRVYLTVAHNKYFWVKKKSVILGTYNYSGTSPRYLQLSWKEVISP